MRKFFIIQLLPLFAFISLLVCGAGSPRLAFWLVVAGLIFSFYAMAAALAGSHVIFHQTEGLVYASPDDKAFLYIQALPEKGDKAAVDLAEHYLRFEEYEAVEVKMLNGRRAVFTAEDFMEELI